MLQFLVSIQIALESAPSTPSWMGEVVAFAHRSLRRSSLNGYGTSAWSSDRRSPHSNCVQPNLLPPVLSSWFKQVSLRIW